MSLIAYTIGVDGLSDHGQRVFDELHEQGYSVRSYEDASEFQYSRVLEPSKDDTVFFYISENQDTDHVVQTIDSFQFDQRVIFSENSSKKHDLRFLDDLGTLYLKGSLQGQGEAFRDSFWAADSIDHNEDGVLSWQERYANAYLSVENPEWGFLASPVYYVGGEPSFESEISILKKYYF